MTDEEKRRDQLLRAPDAVEEDAAPRIEVTKHDDVTRIDIAPDAAVRRAARDEEEETTHERSRPTGRGIEEGTAANRAPSGTGTRTGTPTSRPRSLGRCDQGEHRPARGRRSHAEE